MKTLFLIIAMAFPTVAMAQFEGLVPKPSAASETIPVPIPDPVPDRSAPLEVSQIPIVYLKAAAAEVIPSGDGVLIFAEELKPGNRYGMILRVANQPVEFAEVHPKANPFPPQVIQPFRNNTFLIEGNVGDVFYVSIRAYGEAPTWETVTITRGDDPGPGPVDPPPVTDGEIEKLSRARADALNDPPTRTALKASLMAAIAKVEALCASGDCPDVTGAARELVVAIETAMGQRTGASLDVEWKAAWRTPISEAIKIKSPKSAAEYLSLIKEAAKGL